jgi:hypothetical protein
MPLGAAAERQLCDPVFTRPKEKAHKFLGAAPVVGPAGVVLPSVASRDWMKEPSPRAGRGGIYYFEPMDKKARLKLIREAYQQTRNRKHKLTPKTWQFLQELREETNDQEADVVVDFSEQDIFEELQFIKGQRRSHDDDVDWDNSRYYDTNTSAEMIYFRRPRE